MPNGKRNYKGQSMFSQYFNDFAFHLRSFIYSRRLIQYTLDHQTARINRHCTTRKTSFISIFNEEKIADKLRKLTFFPSLIQIKKKFANSTPQIRKLTYFIFFLSFIQNIQFSNSVDKKKSIFGSYVFQIRQKLKKIVLSKRPLIKYPFFTTPFPIQSLLILKMGE